MIEHLTGTIVDGSLRLDQKPKLPDHSRVRVTLEPLAEAAAASRTDLDLLIESFAKYSRRVGPRTWKREDLYER